MADTDISVSVLANYIGKPIYRSIPNNQNLEYFNLNINAVVLSHSMLRYPVLAELVYGEFNGCFQKPSDSVLPDSNISCPDITPIEYQEKEMVNRQAMLNPSQLTHPDVSTSRRYVSGTRFVVLIFTLHCFDPSRLCALPELSVQY